jgi:hypothetical protein
MSNTGGKFTRRDTMKMSLWNLGEDPLWWPFLVPSRMNSTMLETMMTSTRYG